MIDQKSSPFLRRCESRGSRACGAQDGQCRPAGGFSFGAPFFFAPFPPCSSGGLMFFAFPRFASPLIFRQHPWLVMTCPVAPCSALYHPVPPRTALYRPVPPSTAQYRAFPPPYLRGLAPQMHLRSASVPDITCTIPDFACIPLSLGEPLVPPLVPLVSPSPSRFFVKKSRLLTENRDFLTKNRDF